MKPLARRNGWHERAPRELTELELVEVSLVTFPMQPRARVHALEDGREAV